MAKVNPLDWFMILLVVIGGGCWLAAGLFNLNLIKLFTFNMEWLGRLFYVAVGIAAHYLIYFAIRVSKS